MQKAANIRNICVYCGSGPGRNPAFAEAARDFGRILAAEQIGLVYGGGSLGLMGETARSVLRHGGQVTGIIPAFLSAARAYAARGAGARSWSTTCISGSI